MSRTYRRPAPVPGAHTAELFHRYLGLGEDEIARLKRLGIL